MGISVSIVFCNSAFEITVPEPAILLASAYYFPTTGRIHGVEVLKGPSAITQGPSTIGGALNLISTPIPTEGKGKFVQELGEHGMMRTHAVLGGEYGRCGAMVEVHDPSTEGLH